MPYHHNKSNLIKIKKYLFVLGLLVIITITCCKLTSPKENRYNLDDPELIPFAAMYKIDRQQYCLTEIDKNATVQIEKDYYATRGYDIMLHIYSNNVSRTVAFMRQNGEYVWIGEQEIHRSERKFRTEDGEFWESISVTYYQKKMKYGILELSIRYNGDIENSIFPEHRSDLTCEEVKPYIEEWDKNALSVQ